MKKVSDLFADISKKNDIRKKDVKIVVNNFMNHLKICLDEGEKFSISGMTFTPRTRAAKDAEGDTPAKEEMKFLILRKIIPVSK